ncbi:MAG TPA: hypothetical protein VGD56_21490, partial [Gemmatirosa sp.]
MTLRGTVRAALCAAACAAALSAAWGGVAGAQAPARGAAAARAWRAAHDHEVLREFAALLAIPNLASDSVGIRRNAAALVAALGRRGVAARLLESPAGG